MGTNRKRLYVGVVVGMVSAAAIATGVYASVRGSDGVPAGAVAAAPNGSIALSNCKLPKADFITNDTTGLSTTSTTPVAVPGMTKNINIAGSVASCVIIDVSGYAFAPGGALEFVSVTLDGNQGNPTEVQFAGDTKGSFAEQHAALFAFGSVPPGAHSVTMVFRSLDGKTVFIHKPAMEIEHK